MIANYPATQRGQWQKFTDFIISAEPLAGTQSAVVNADGMICNSFLFFDRMVEMMITVCAAPDDMNPVDVLHRAEKFELAVIASPPLWSSRIAAGTMETLNNLQRSGSGEPLPQQTGSCRGAAYLHTMEGTCVANISFKSKRFEVVKRICLEMPF